MKKTKKLLMLLALLGVLGGTFAGCKPETPDGVSSSSEVTSSSEPSIEESSAEESSAEESSTEESSTDESSSDESSSDESSSDEKPESPVVDAGAYNGSLSAKLGMGGYEWGPAVDMLVFKVNGKVKAENLSAEMFTASTEVRTWTNTETRVLSVVDAYPCTEGGHAVAESEYFAVKFKATYGVLSPFTYANNVNNWTDGNLTVSVALAEGKKLSIEEGTQIKNYNAFSFSDPLAIADRVSPSTDGLKKGTHKVGDNTLTYAAYETEEMKNDGVKNPLVIWLHGAGEGGTDVDIALLGNDVTNLMEEKVQSHFIDEQVKGAYVLAVQTPTMWMNDGTGEYTQNGTSMYTEALMETIKNYAETVNKDVDLDRVYVGGCSNGGFMTMNLLINHGDYFAAAYPVCQAYNDSWITDEQITALSKKNIWFTHAANDTTVAPKDFTNATYARLVKAGAKNVYFSYFQNVVGTDDPKAQAAWGSGGGNYMGHFSWIYTLQDQCTRVQDPNLAAVENLVANNNGGGKYIVSVNDEETTLWGWMAAQKKGVSVGSAALDPNASEETPGGDEGGAGGAGGSNGGTLAPADGAVRFEAENAELGQLEGAENPIQIETNDAISGGKGVGYFSTAGQTITIKITSDKAVDNVAIHLGVAPAIVTNFSFDAGGFVMTIGDLSAETLATCASFTLNGEAVTFSGDTLTGNAASNFWNVGVFTATVNLKAGENVFVITSLGQAINLDYVDVYASVS